MATFAIGSESLLAGNWSTSLTATFHSAVGNSSEIWIRLYGDSFKVNYRAGSTTPVWVSVDGGAWAQPAGAFANSPSTTVLSGELLPGTPTDTWHDVRIRLANGNSGGGFKLRTADAFVVTSTGGVAAIEAHTDFGQYETVGGAFGVANWRHTFPAARTGTTTNYVSPIFYGSSPTNATTSCRNAYCEFYVDTNTTKLFVFSENSGTAASRTFSIWIDDVRQAPSLLEDTTAGTYGLSGSYSIPGSGTRKIRVSNLRALHSLVVDGAFVATPIAAPTYKIGWSGDSVTSADSVTTAADASGNWDQLLDVYYAGQVTILNRGLSGDTATAWGAAASNAGRVADFPTDLNLVIANMSVNDAARAVTVPATVQAEYQDYYTKLLNRCTSATIVAVPQLPYQTSNRSAIVAVIQAAVTAIANSRLIYASSDGWVSSINEGAHPKDLGKIEAVGGGMAAINLAAQPADGDTVTINGTVFEFDSNASVTGGRTAVTIGGSLTATIDNLAAAIEAAGQSFRMIEKIIVSGDTTKQGVGIKGCTALSKSGVNINVYGPQATGWMTLIDAYLPTDGGGGGGGDTDTASGSSYRRNGSDIVKHTFDWVSSGSGNATLVSGLPISGQIERVVIVPDDVASPTTNYDITLTDTESIDVLSGQGANLSATAASTVRPGTPLKDGTTTSTVPVVVDSVLTLNVSNAGDTKAGRVLVYVR